MKTSYLMPLANIRNLAKEMIDIIIELSGEDDKAKQAALKESLKKLEADLKQEVTRLK
jgi:hypothetical protein